MIRKLGVSLFALGAAFCGMLMCVAEELPEEMSREWSSPFAVVLLVIMVTLVIIMGYYKIRAILARDKKYSRRYKE